MADGSAAIIGGHNDSGIMTIDGAKFDQIESGGRIIGGAEEFARYDVAAGGGSWLIDTARPERHISGESCVGRIALAERASIGARDGTGASGHCRHVIPLGTPIGV